MSASVPELEHEPEPLPMVRAQVAITRLSSHTDIRITPGGIAGDLLMKTLGIARKIRGVLLTAPGIGHNGPVPG
jgi:hypothetical protein